MSRSVIGEQNIGVARKEPWLIGVEPVVCYRLIYVTAINTLPGIGSGIGSPETRIPALVL